MQKKSDDVVKGSTTKVSQTLVWKMIDGEDSIIGVVVGVDCESTNMGKVVIEFREVVGISCSKIDCKARVISSAYTRPLIFLICF